MPRGSAGCRAPRGRGCKSASSNNRDLHSTYSTKHVIDDVGASGALLPTGTDNKLHRRKPLDSRGDLMQGSAVLKMFEMCSGWFSPELTSRLR